jgi:hypothetical protein
MSSETMFIGLGILIVLYFVYDILRKETRRPQRPRPDAGAGNQGQAPQQNPVNFKGGNFDADSFNKARAIMGALNNYPDDLSKSMALADYLHREKTRENQPNERRREPDMKGEALLDGFARLLDRFTGPSRRTEKPYNTDFMDRGHDYPQGRKNRRIDGYPPYRQDDYPLRDRNGRWE